MGAWWWGGDSKQLDVFWEGSLAVVTPLLNIKDNRHYPGEKEGRHSKSRKREETFLTKKTGSAKT